MSVLLHLANWKGGSVFGNLFTQKIMSLLGKDRWEDQMGLELLSLGNPMVTLALVLPYVVPEDR